MKYKQSPYSWEDTRITIMLKTGKPLDSSRQLAFLNQNAKLFTAVLASRMDSSLQIAFLNQNTKLFTAVLASRISVTIKYYVSSDQLEFIPQSQ